MRRRFPAVIVTLLAFALLPGVAVARPPFDTARAEHDRIVAHWTPERMKTAIPRDFVRAFGAFARAPAPAKPPGGGGSGNVSGASWTKGGLIAEASGKVYFEMDGSGWVCSGSVVDDTRSGYSIVLTAAHCAYDETAGGALSGFATNWMFIPNFDAAPTWTCGSTKYGCWTAEALFVHSGFATAGGFNSQATYHDFAFALVGPGGKSGSAQLDSTTGDFPIAFSTLAEGTKMYAFGYPAAGKYRGNDLVYCAGPVFYDPYNSKRTYGMTCGMTGGSSGGPWLSGFSESTGSGTLSSLNSYGYSGIRAMHGPWFDSNASDVFAAANGSAISNTIVP